MMGLLLIAVLAAGIVLVTLGWRGTPGFSEPHCRRCDYDVRMIDWASGTRICPECGSDLTQPEAVRFGTFRKRTKLIWSGVGVCLLPLLVVGLAQLQRTMGFRWKRPESNASIIVNLSRTADSPWDWTKLEDRYWSGDLSHAEVVAAVDQLIAHLQKKTGIKGPLHSAGRFLDLGWTRGHVNDKQMIRLCRAYYGPNPEVRMRNRIGEGRNLEIEIRSQNSWDLIGVQHVLALRELTIDSKAVTPTSKASYDKKLGMNAFSGGGHRAFEVIADQRLSPGSHELTFTYDWGLLVGNAARNPKFDGRHGQKEHWPKPIITWESTDRREIEVVPEGEPVIGMVTDEARSPASAISIDRIQVFPYGDKLRVETKHRCDAVDPAVCMRIIMRAGEDEYDLGWFGREGNRSTSSVQRDIEELPHDLTKVTVILQPDAELAEQRLITNEIWGQPIIIEGVPLERFDLNDEAESTQ